MKVRSGIWGASFAALCTAGVLSVAAVAQQAAPPPTPPAAPPTVSAPGAGGPPPATPQPNAGQPGADRAAARAADRAAFFDARLAAIHAGLQLSPEQEALWGPVESAVRDGMKSGAAMRQKDAEAGRPSSWFDGMRRRAERASTRGAAMKRFADAAEPLYTSLTDDQKRRLRVLMRPMGQRMMPAMGQNRYQRDDERGGPDRMGPPPGRFGGRDRMDDDRGRGRPEDRFRPQDRQDLGRGGGRDGDRFGGRGERDGANPAFADRFRGGQERFDGRAGRSAPSWRDRQDGGSPPRGPARDIPDDDDGNNSQL